jgi:ribosomal protein S18 acetylase RimI-like enzyme
MLIDHAVLEDVHAVAQVHVSASKAGYAGIIPAEALAAQSIAQREAQWRDAIIRGTPDLAVAKDEGSVVGFVAFGASRDEGAPATAGEICLIYVSPSHWSRGVGRQLWLYARDCLAGRGYTSVSLWVLAENTRAINFYLAAGFLPDSSSKSIRYETTAGKQLEETRYVAALTGFQANPREG